MPVDAHDLFLMKAARIAESSEALANYKPAAPARDQLLSYITACRELIRAGSDPVLNTFGICPSSLRHFLEECRFRGDPATHSDLMPPPIPE